MKKPERAKKATFDILGLGCAAVDDFLYVPAYPPANAKVRVLSTERQCGGLTATALVAAARLGAHCAYAGVLGDDELSRYVIESLRREGVDVSPVIVRPEARPIHSTIIVESGGPARTIFYTLSGACGADPERPEAATIRSSRVLFADHFGAEGMIRAARIARESGIPVVADFESDEGPRFEELLGLADHLIVSQDFAAKLTGCSDPRQAVRKLWSSRCQVVAVTAGEEGCWYVGGSQAEPSHQPAFRVPVADTTGCGDVFHGAYAAALAQGLSLQGRLRFAAAAAALKATKRGGQQGIPTRAAVEKFLAEARYKG
ncbi:MAG: permease [Planctomycetes bacterium]|nr:permease [Planctomycetota bacterium]